MAKRRQRQRRVSSRWRMSVTPDRADCGLIEAGGPSRDCRGRSQPITAARRLPLYVAVMAGWRGSRRCAVVRFFSGRHPEGLLRLFRARGGIVAQSSLCPSCRRHFMDARNPPSRSCHILPVAMRFSLGSARPQRFSIGHRLFSRPEYARHTLASAPALSSLVAIFPQRSS